METLPDMEATVPITQLRVDGMTCNNCARHVTEASQSVSGVRSATISLTAKQAVIRWNSALEKNVPAVIAAITQAGYEAREMTTAGGGAGRKESRLAMWQFNLWLGVTVTVLLMLGDWVFQLMPVPWFRWLSFGLAAVVQVWCGAQFYQGAWRQLKVGSSNMDTLVALGSTTAFGFSCWVLFTGAPTDHLFFMEAVAIISLISLGHWFEARVSERASGALQALLTLAPATARRLQGANPPGAPKKLSARDLLSFKPAAVPALPSEVEVETPVTSLRTGDLIVLKPGDRVPVDGVVTAGESAVDEAMLTGESAPVDKKPAGELYAGTVNLNGRLVMRVTATGEGTALARVIAAVQRAQTSRADIQRLGDRVSNVFVPVIVLAALGSALWWGLGFDSARHFHVWLAPYLWHAHPPATAMAAAFIVAAAVLIVACPCAMGLATPAAIMAAANAAARRGILIRDGVALEKAGKVTAVIFDKTGTLTEGKPEVAEFVEFSVMVQKPNAGDVGSPSSAPLPLTPALSLGERENSSQSQRNNMLQLAGALARPSTHPLSLAIARAAADVARPELTEWQELRGQGVQAKWRGVEAGTVVLRLGSLTWLREYGVEMTPGEAFIAEWSAKGATLVGLAQDGKLSGLMAVKDTLKTGAAAVVAQLQRQGLKTYLLTGDNPLTAASIAQQTGIPAGNVFAGVRPEQKADFVKRLQMGGERVAFVGDGINDAPALTQADLGIAVSRASDIAREAADIILLKSEIEAVPEALGLARATLRIIKQNLFWAFFYNALGVPLAATGFASPVLCAAAMGFSDLIVIGNALRLLRWR